ncbi:MAG: bifunctional oligoribonuclease/PAP phosphatase NrnA [Lachnospiraceae bacterium]|nr:bifunctional oligoribonuclease/PAP phosphatase NrnA [Lachnospiraceae bacterium]
MTIQDFLTTEVHSVVISGHVNPDGDCLGSCMALRLYLKKACPGLDVQVLLEKPREEIAFLEGVDSIISEDTGLEPDLFILLDCADSERIGFAAETFKRARHSLCIDHHVDHGTSAEQAVIKSTYGSCAEVLYELLDPAYLDKAIAEALYLAIIQDTGVFQYSNARPETLRIAADLMTYGIDTATIVYDSFTSRTFKQSKILGYCLDHCIRFAHDKAVIMVLDEATMAAYEARRPDLGEVVSAMRLIKGIEVSVFAYPLKDGVFKVSFRSARYLDVNALANQFGGGGHIRAAGASLEGTADTVRETLMKAVEKELQ